MMGGRHGWGLGGTGCSAAALLVRMSSRQFACSKRLDFSCFNGFSSASGSSGIPCTITPRLAGHQRVDNSARLRRVFTSARVSALLTGIRVSHDRLGDHLISYIASLMYSADALSCELSQHFQSPSVFSLVLLSLYFLGFNCIASAGSPADVDVCLANAHNFSNGCDGSSDTLQQARWRQQRASCTYNVWFSTADESLVVADQLARPLLKLQGYGFHEDVAWSIGCAWCSSASAPIIASGGWDGSLMWWNASTGAFLFKQSLSQGIITAISGHQTSVPPAPLLLIATWKGSILAVSPCSSNGPVDASDSGNGIAPSVVWAASASSTPLRSLCLCGGMAFAGSNDGVVTSVNLLDGKILNQTRVSSEALWSMACSPGRNDRFIAVAGNQ